MSIVERGEHPLGKMVKILCCNVRGLNNSDKQVAIKKLISQQQVGLLGLLETRIKTPNMGKVYLKMFSEWCFSNNNPWHAGGRIIIAWKPSIFHVNIVLCTSQIMHLKVELISRGVTFFVTFVYGFNKEESRKSLWKELSLVHSLEAWVVLGDFNAILKAEDRIGDRANNAPSMDFVKLVEECGLEDVKYSGNFFTWTNKQNGSARIYSKIDRVMANVAWFEYFERAEVVFMNEHCLDHTPAILSLQEATKGRRNVFRYFKMWKSHP